MLIEELIELVLLRCMNCDAKTTAEAVVNAFFDREWRVVDAMDEGVETEWPF